MIPIWLRALTSPFSNLSQLLKFGAIPVLLTVGIELVETLLVSTGIIVMAAPFWTLLAFTIAYVPFEVGWTRLTINGPAAVADRSYFAFARTESHYLVATILFEVAWTVTLVPALLMRLGTRNFDWPLVFEGGFLLFAVFVAILVGLIRLLFIFPAIALGRYRGVATAWRQSKGSFERLAALELLARLPYLLAIDLIDRLILPYSDRAFTAVMRGSQCLVLSVW
jgi:hypothetical protein